MRINVSDISAQRLFLGWTGEKNHLVFAYDFADMFAEYPDAGASLTIQPPTGDAYPHTLTREGNVLLWDVLESDCAHEGDGTYQITFTQGEHVAKSLKGFFTVRESLTGSGEAPDPVQNWIAEAEAALFALTGMRARAETLAPGSAATAQIVEENGHKVIVLGVPEGRKGDPGEPGDPGKDGKDGEDGKTPSFSIGTVTTLPAGSPATVTITGTPESPVLNLGIPRGEDADPAELIDDKAGEGVTNKVWSASKSAAEFTRLKSDIQAKQDAPSVAGTPGQVLGLDENLDPVWVDQTGGGGTVDDSALAPVIKNTASGEIASFPDGADNRLIDSLVVNITPVQDLHGQDAPYPPGGGVNKFDQEYYSNRANFTTSYNNYHYTDPIILKPNTQYIFKSNQTTALSSAIYLYLRVIGGDDADALPGTDDGGIYPVYNGSLTSGVQNVFTTGATGAIRLGVPTNIASEKFAEIWNPKWQLEEGSTATAWTPYKNICPISGWTEANVWDDPKHGGNINFNQLIRNGDFSEGQSYWENQGAGVATISDGVMEITPAGNYGKRLYVSSNARPTIVPGHIYLFVVEAKKNFSARIAIINANMGSCYYQGYLEKTNEWEIVGNRGTGTPSTGTISYLYFADIGSNYVADSGQKIWIRNIRLFDLTQMFGSGKEPTGANFISLLYKDYYPYNTGEVTTVSAVNEEPYRHIQIEFPSETGTVFGANLSLFKDGTGSLVVEQGETDMGSLTWSTASTDTAGKNRFIADIPGIKIGNANQVKLLCSEYKEISGTYQYGLTGIGPHGTVARVLVADVTRAEMTGAEFKAAMDGKQLVYPLATPVTYPLTAEQISGILSTLKGQNNIWADCGDIESVEYSADTKLYIDNKITQAIAAALNS